MQRPTWPAGGAANSARESSVLPEAWLSAVPSRVDRGWCARFVAGACTPERSEQEEQGDGKSHGQDPGTTRIVTTGRQSSPGGSGLVGQSLSLRAPVTPPGYRLSG